MTTLTTAPHAQARLAQIARARSAVMEEGRSMTDAIVQGWWEGAWIERSWRRCLEMGLQPRAPVAFDLVPARALQRLHDAHHALLAAGRPTLEKLSRALASTRYFAILTNEAGVVIDAHGPIDRADRRAHLITRVGVDLSERAVGTSAIGAALAERQPVWLHRGEHFFDDTGCYSCAGAPLFGPGGECVGMLDLTGVDAVERPELKHLVAQAARTIENAMALAVPHRLLLRLNWPGHAFGGDEDGLVLLDADGSVAGSNTAARRMVPALEGGGMRAHATDLFALPWEALFDASRRADPQPFEVSLWSGLRLQVLAQPAGAEAPRTAAPLRDTEIALIRQAVAQARGNVAAAAKALGISRATVYRKLGSRRER